MVSRQYCSKHCREVYRRLLKWHQNSSGDSIGATNKIKCTPYRAGLAKSVRILSADLTAKAGSNRPVNSLHGFSYVHAEANHEEKLQ